VNRIRSRERYVECPHIVAGGISGKKTTLCSTM
jgi:hypothetical protein